MFGFGALTCLLLMVFVRWSNCCCNVSTDNENQLQCTSVDTDNGCITQSSDSDGHKFRCGNMIAEFFNVASLPHHVVIKCTSESTTVILQPNSDCTLHNLKCNTSCNGGDVFHYTCSPIATTSTYIPTEVTTSQQSSNPKTEASTTHMPTHSTTRASLEPMTTTSTTNIYNGETVSIILSTIILIMAVFICAILSVLITKRVRKRKLGHRYRVNNENLVQDNIYQDLRGANRRPSRIIPITTHDGQRLELSEFPRYDNLGNSHKLSNTSLSKQWDKGEFPTDQVSMETSAHLNGFPPCKEHFYSTIPANKVSTDHKTLPEGFAAAPLSTCSSNTSLIIDPYSTLDEARKQAVREIKSTHTEGHADDVLKLNMFGNDTPQWNHDIRPLQLTIPTTYRSRTTSGGGLSLAESEEAYIQMAGDLEGGWGEQWVHHASGFGTTNEHQAELINGLGDSYTFENQHYASTTQARNQFLEQLDGSYLTNEEAPPLPQRNFEVALITDRPLEAPPTPDWDIEVPSLPHRYNDTSPTLDKSIEDLYAKVRKKSKKVNESSENYDDDTVVVINDNCESPQSYNDLATSIPPSTEYMNATMQDSLESQGGPHTQVPANTVLSMEGTIERKHSDMQVSLESKHDGTATHTP